jgi:hypothetical protein
MAGREKLNDIIESVNEQLKFYEILDGLDEDGLLNLDDIQTELDDAIYYIYHAHNEM